LKKQTQFLKRQNGLNPVFTMTYGNLGNLTPGKNKANIDCDECFLPMVQEIATALRASQ